jgi:hypothetical protein
VVELKMSSFPGRGSQQSMVATHKAPGKRSSKRSLTKLGALQTEKAPVSHGALFLYHLCTIAAPPCSATVQMHLLADSAT